MNAGNQILARERISCAGVYAGTQISTKLVRAGAVHGYPQGGTGFFCPGCRFMHVIPPAIDNRGTATEPDFPGEFTEAWRGLPLPGDRHGTPLVPAGRCRYRIVMGLIRFARDCTHRLAGLAVPLPDLPGHLREQP